MIRPDHQRLRHLRTQRLERPPRRMRPDLRAIDLHVQPRPMLTRPVRPDPRRLVVAQRHLPDLQRASRPQRPAAHHAAPRRHPRRQLGRRLTGLAAAPPRRIDHRRRHLGPGSRRDHRRHRRLDPRRQRRRLTAAHQHHRAEPAPQHRRRRCHPRARATSRPAAHNQRAPPCEARSVQAACKAAAAGITSPCSPRRHSSARSGASITPYSRSAS